jgi:1-acyl-sn-glycerol-3-phosphate acyltransferase
VNKFYDFCSLLARAFYRLFFKVEIIGAERIDFTKRYVICANHISNHDPFLLGGFMPMQAHFMAKKELFKYKIVAKVLDMVYVFPVDRENNDIHAIKKALKLLRSNENLGLFPEGTRNKTFAPLPVKGGVAMMAYRTETPILPITIDTTYRFFGPIRIVYHDPIYLDAYYGQKIDAPTLEAKSQAIVNQLYADMVFYKPARAK